MNTLGVKASVIEEKKKKFEKAMKFEKTEIEEVKRKDNVNADKIIELEDKLLYREVYDRREKVRFLGIPEFTTYWCPEYLV